MQCPYCEQVIPRLPTYIHICPYCHSILNNALRERAFPLEDSQRRRTKEYKAEKEYLKQRGSNTYSLLTKLDEKNQKAHKSTMIILWLNVVLFTAATIFSFAIDDMAVYGVLSIFILIFTICGIRKTNQLRKEYKLQIYSSKKDTPTPILYYGNEYIFGIASSPANSNSFNKLPIVIFTEIPKENILDVHLDEHINKWVDIEYIDPYKREQIITIPLFCDELTMQNILGVSKL